MSEDNKQIAIDYCDNIGCDYISHKTTCQGSVILVTYLDWEGNQNSESITLD